MIRISRIFTGSFSAPHKRDFGTIRLLIDAINRAERESEETPAALP